MTRFDYATVQIQAHTNLSPWKDAISQEISTLIVTGGLCTFCVSHFYKLLTGMWDSTQILIASNSWLRCVYSYECVCVCMFCTNVCMCIHLHMYMLRVYSHCICVTGVCVLSIFVNVCIVWLLKYPKSCFFINRSHTKHFRVMKIWSQCSLPTFHHAYHVINSFQHKQLMLFIWN